MEVMEDSQVSEHIRQVSEHTNQVSEHSNLVTEVLIQGSIADLPDQVRKKVELTNNEMKIFTSSKEVSMASLDDYSDHRPAAV